MYTDERCWNAIKVERAWMCGEASYDELATAQAAAWDAQRVKERKGYSHERAWQIKTLKRLIAENEKEEQR